MECADHQHDKARSVTRNEIVFTNARTTLMTTSGDHAGILQPKPPID